MADDMLKQTCEFEYGTLNPAVPHDTNPMLDINTYDPLALVSRVCHDAAYKVGDKKDNAYKAIVMRVDYNFNGYCEVKARIPEKDGCRPEPAEFCATNIKSNSHYTIDMHRTYSWSGRTPLIGQVVLVKIPEDGSYNTPGEIIDLLPERYVAGRIKSSKLDSQSAIPPPGNSLSMDPPPGDQPGGPMDPGSQTSPFGEQLASAADEAVEAASDYLSGLFGA